MTEFLTQIGVQNVTALVSTLLMFVGICAFMTSMITEAFKSVKEIEKLPTKLVCYVVAILVTPTAFCGLMSYLKQPIEWFMVFASFLASFVVAKVSMGGWDDVTELWGRMMKK